MKSKKILVSGYIGFNNFGDEAIFQALSSHLKSLDIEVSVLCNNKKDTEAKYNVKGYKYNSIFEVIKGIINCNILFSGGGSLLQNKTSNFSLYYYLFIIVLAKLLFKKVVIFAQGIEPVRGNFNKFITKTVLKMTDYITVRDINSYNLLSKNNIKSELLSDPVYSLIENTKIKENKQGLIIQLRSFEGIDEDFINNLAHAICDNYKEEVINILPLQDNYDKEISLKFQEKLNNLGKKSVVISQKNISDIIEIINNTKYMISTRLHGIIVAQALKTKVFSLIYDDKIQTISDELDIENIVIRNYSKEELNKKIKLFFETENKTKQNRKFKWEKIDEKIKLL